jgi:hypothetical protein
MCTEADVFGIFLVEGGYIHSKSARTAAAPPRPAETARPALMGRAAHSVEAKAVVRIEVAVRPPSHTQRKTDRAKASHHELSGSARTGWRPGDSPGRNRTARSRIDARRYRDVRPDELRAGRSIASRDHIKSKEKVNARLSSPGLRRVRLELPGVSSQQKPAGSPASPLICLLSAAAFSPLPQAGSVDHADRGCR